MATARYASCAYLGAPSPKDRDTADHGALKPHLELSMPVRSPYTVTLTLKITPLLHSELQAEAWESKLELKDYVRTLLSSRGKYGRMVGLPGGYMIGLLKEHEKRVAADLKRRRSAR